jgi:hypothetical protein
MGKHLLNAALVLFASSTALGAAGVPKEVTFYKDVMPILRTIARPATGQGRLRRCPC